MCACIVQVQVQVHVQAHKVVQAHMQATLGLPEVVHFQMAQQCVSWSLLMSFSLPSNQFVLPLSLPVLLPMAVELDAVHE